MNLFTMEIGRIIYIYVCVHQYLLPRILMVAPGQGRPFFSDAFCAAIAALKIHPKRSHTLLYGSRYRVNFCLALTTQKASEILSWLGFTSNFNFPDMAQDASERLWQLND